MVHRLAFLLIPFLFLFSANSLLSQETKVDTAFQMVVETKDGNLFVGKILELTATSVILRTEKFGDLTIQKDQIVQMVPVGTENDPTSKVWFENPHASRYFFGPNAYGLRRGEGYYSNTWIFINQVSFGITNNLTMGVGMIPLFLFDGAPTPVWVTPKVSFPIKKDKVNIAVGGLFASIIGESDATFGVAYGQLTLGSRDQNVNLGLGYGYAGNDWAQAPTLTLSGTLRTGRKFALMTENYFFDTGDSNTTLLGLGGRFLGKHLAVDGALIIPFFDDEGLTAAIPWLGIHVPFGRYKDK